MKEATHLRNDISREPNQQTRKNINDWNRQAKRNAPGENKLAQLDVLTLKNVGNDRRPHTRQPSKTIFHTPTTSDC
jgi:hypothetical protein